MGLMHKIDAFSKKIIKWVNSVNSSIDSCDLKKPYDLCNGHPNNSTQIMITDIDLFRIYYVLGHTYLFIFNKIKKPMNPEKSIENHIKTR